MSAAVLAASLASLPPVDPAWRPAVPWGDRPWTVHEGDNRCSLDAYDAEVFDAVVTDCPYGLSDELDPPNLDKEALWARLVEAEQNPQPLRHYLTACHSEFIAANNRAPSAAEWLDLADEADRRRMVESPPIARLIWHWLATGENPRTTGKGFMGNEWDALVPSPNTWKAVWRVLKPGAYLLTFAGTRTDDLVALSLRLAGFRVEDRIIWLQGQGMAKRRRLDLAIDTYLGAKARRPVVGSKLGTPGYSLAPSKGSNVFTHGGLGGTGDPVRECQIDAAATPEAARHVGWDRGLHPRQEPVIVATKPMRGTVAQTALAYGTGGMNVDACRILRGDAGETKKSTRTTHREDRTYGRGLGDGNGENYSIHPGGGYPTNVLIDEAVADELDRRTGVRKSGARAAGTYGQRDGDGVYNACAPREQPSIAASEGGASRFFYTAKASSSERDAGLEDLVLLTPGERSNQGHRDSPTINGYVGTRAPGRNPHNTVKPVGKHSEDGMRYLVRLACPPGRWHEDVIVRPLVLDPFCGSGSTLVAGLLEGVRVVGCELGAVYADVARRRCQHAYALPRERSGGESAAPATTTEDAPKGQRKLF